jgi:hypothetical protein
MLSTLGELLSRLSLTEEEKALIDSENFDLSMQLLPRVSSQEAIEPARSEGEESKQSSRRTSDSTGSQATRRVLLYPDYTPSGEAVRFSKASPAVLATADMDQRVLLTYKVNNHGIKIVINGGQRPLTSLSGSQGDHITAYTTFLQSICGLVDGEDVHEAPGILYEATQCFLSTDKRDKFAQLFEKTKRNGGKSIFPQGKSETADVCVKGIQGK